MMMNKQIAKKLKFDQDRVPSCMYHFGNTSSASIPLTIVTELQSVIEGGKLRIIACGFGVGLSWGTVFFETDKVVVSDLVEVVEPIEGLL